VTSHPRTRSIVSLAAILALMSGCSLDEYRGAESLFALTQPASPAEAARMAVNRDNPDERYLGTLMLANAYFGGEPIYIELYKQAVEDDSANVRSAGVRGLANHGAPEHVPLLVTRLDDTDRNVRLEAARGLQRLHNPVAIPALIRALDPEIEEVPDIRAEAADALGQYADARVISPLIIALKDNALIVNDRALHSLQTLTNHDYGFDWPVWFEWYNTTPDPFAQRDAYTYPVFSRDKKWYEWIPFVPQPPNEPEASPVGMPPIRPSENVRADG
jgi:hypothetical protein